MVACVTWTESLTQVIDLLKTMDYSPKCIFSWQGSAQSSWCLGSALVPAEYGKKSEENSSFKNEGKITKHNKM